MIDPMRKVRSTDPETSRRAAWSALPRAGNQRHRILVAIASSSCGLTYDEVSTSTGIRGVSASTRISELHQGGWLEPIGERKTSAGASATLWGLTLKALAALDAGSLSMPDQSASTSYQGNRRLHDHESGRSGAESEQAALFTFPRTPAWG